MLDEKATRLGASCEKVKNCSYLNGSKPNPVGLHSEIYEKSKIIFKDRINENKAEGKDTKFGVSTGKSWIHELR